MQIRRERILTAKWAGLRARMLQSWRIPEERADRWLAEWRVEAVARGLEDDHPAFWSEAADWIQARQSSERT